MSTSMTFEVIFLLIENSIPIIFYILFRERFFLPFKHIIQYIIHINNLFIYFKRNVIAICSRTFMGKMENRIILRIGSVI